MEEKVTETLQGQPEPCEERLPVEGEATTPTSTETNSPFVEVKFNKETKKLSLEEASTLAQMGLKYQMVEKEFDRLRALSKSRGLSVAAFLSEIEEEKAKQEFSVALDRCNGDRELAEKLMKKEDAKPKDDFAELLQEFPHLKSEALPNQVKTAAELKGTGLLFEYLLYEHRQRVAADEEKRRHEMTAEKSLGSLSSTGGQNLVDAEFLKGVWG